MGLEVDVLFDLEKIRLEILQEKVEDGLVQFKTNRSIQWTSLRFEKILLETLLEMINKTTAKKVEKVVVDEQEASGFSETCPTCHVFVFDNYCHHCGQNLDWE